MCSDADGWDSNLLSEVRPSDFVILLLLEDVGIMTPKTKIKKKLLKLVFSGRSRPADCVGEHHKRGGLV